MTVNFEEQLKPDTLEQHCLIDMTVAGYVKPTDCNDCEVKNDQQVQLNNEKSGKIVVEMPEIIASIIPINVEQLEIDSIPEQHCIPEMAVNELLKPNNCNDCDTNDHKEAQLTTNKNGRSKKPMKSGRTYVQIPGTNLFVDVKRTVLATIVFIIAESLVFYCAYLVYWN